MILQQLIQHTFIGIRSGFRAHSFRIVFLLGCFLMMGAWLAGEFSARQSMTVALDVGLSGIRVIVTLMVLFWVQEWVARDVERKNLLWILAYPAPRSTYLLGRYVGILLLSFGAVALLGLLLLVVVTCSGLAATQTSKLDLGFAYWVTLVWISLDIWVVSAFSLLVATFSTSGMMPFLMGLAFAVSGRTLGSVIAYLVFDKTAQTTTPTALAEFIRGIQWVLPDLSRLDLREVCLYGQPFPAAQMHHGALMVLCYCIILLGMACYQLSRREIN